MGDIQNNTCGHLIKVPGKPKIYHTSTLIEWLLIELEFIWLLNISCGTDVARRP